MWWGSVTLRVKGKEVPRDVTRLRSRITQDEVKSGVNLRTEAGRDSERQRNGRRMSEGETEQEDKKEEEGIIRTHCSHM